MLEEHLAVRNGDLVAPEKITEPKQTTKFMVLVRGLVVISGCAILCALLDVKTHVHSLALMITHN
ncbi:hypothetical protein LZ32DRAFT_139131 [Colletotrichum eremochloae]|nr:hypothetical protein LZ32DRAFT_139131 [Colletotrichum eremochloae]